MYRLIQEQATIEDGLYADLLMDVSPSFGGEIDLAICPHGIQPIYLIPLETLTADAKQNFDHGQMRKDSFKIFNTYDEYCRWFNANVVQNLQ